MKIYNVKGDIKETKNRMISMRKVELLIRLMQSFYCKWK